MIAIVRALDIAVAPIGRTDHHYANCMDVIAVGCRVRKISRLMQTYVDRAETYDKYLMILRVVLICFESRRM